MEGHWTSENHRTLAPSLRPYFLVTSLIPAAALMLAVLLNFFRVDEFVIPLPLRIADGLPLGFVGRFQHCSCGAACHRTGGKWTNGRVE